MARTGTLERSPEVVVTELATQHCVLVDHGLVICHQLRSEIVPRIGTVWSTIKAPTDRNSVPGPKRQLALTVLAVIMGAESVAVAVMVGVSVEVGLAVGVRVSVAVSAGVAVAGSRVRRHVHAEGGRQGRVGSHRDGVAQAGEGAREMPARFGDRGLAGAGG